MQSELLCVHKERNMEEKIVFLTKEQAKKMIDESPGDLIPVSITKQDGSGSIISKIKKHKCCVYVDESKTITCEFGDIFDNIALYNIRQVDIKKLERKGTEVKTILLQNK